MTALYPRIGVAVFVVHDSKILMGKRKGAHGATTWAPPGGHLEFQESLESCAQREVLEETGVTIKNIRRCTFTNDIFLAENKHYVTLFMVAEYNSGMVAVLEPDKCEEWRWFEWENLPQPLFLPLQNLQAQGFSLENF